MRHLGYYNTDKPEAELRALGIEFEPATSDYNKKKFIEDWYLANKKYFGLNERV